MKKLFTFFMIALFAIDVMAELGYGVTLTQNDFNNSSTVVKKNGTIEWDGDAVRCGGSSTSITGGPAWNWDEKSFDVHLANGVPAKLSFQYKGNAGGSTGVTFKVQESANGSDWTEVWSTTSNTTSYKSISKDLQLSTRYLRFSFAGNFAGLFKDIKVTEKILMGTPNPEALDFGEKHLGEEASMTFTLGWTNLTGTVTCSDSHFTVTPENFGEIGANLQTTTFTVTMNTEALGSYSGTITIEGRDKSATVAVSGSVAKAAAVEVPVELTMCEGGVAHFRDNDYVSAGSYSYLVEDPIRDTLFTISVTELQPTYGTDTKTIVAGAQETWNGIDLSTYGVGVHEVPFYTTNVAGCDSTVTLTLTVNKQDAVVVNEALSFCQGGSVEYRDKTYTEAGTDVINVQGAVRDTVINVTIVELLPTYGHEDKTIAVGAEETWHGIDLSTYAVGVYDDLMDVMTNVAGCDSIITLTLTVNKQATVEMEYPIEFCADDEQEYRGVVYTEAGSFPLDLIEGTISDTLITVIVTVNDKVQTIDYQEDSVGVAIELPEGEWLLGDSVVIGSYELQVADTAGLEFVQYGETEKGCESVAKIIVTVLYEEETVDPGQTTALERVKAQTEAVKEFRNGTLYIRRGERLFTAEGREVK